MKIIKEIKQMQDLSKKIRLKDEAIGFVPTMGALHEGHLSLIRQARKDNDRVVVSIFVNPTQFAPNEDFRKYPRNLKRDAALCRKVKVDFIFYPDAKDMYPRNYKTTVEVCGLSDALCAKSRPGHFRGVATVVVKLFNIVQPDVAYFGQKDAQQSVIIKRMVRDLNMPLKIRVMPTVREKDGLALSSRNAYLDKREREDAVVLSRALSLAELLIKSGLKDVKRITDRIRQVIQKKDTAKIEYVSIVDMDELKPVKRISGDCLIALAARIGKTRLIDNIIIGGHLSD